MRTNPHDLENKAAPIPLHPQTRLGKIWWGLVKFGFRLLYNEMAWTYDLVAWVVSFGQWWDWQRTALPLLEVQAGDRVLEIAHGTGSLQIDMEKLGYQRIGLDFSPYMGRIARRKLHKKSISAPLVRAKAQAIPLPTASLDGIVSTFPSEFIIDPETLRETYRVLKPGGKLVIVGNALLTKGGLAKDALEAAYRVTGQRGDYQSHIEQAFTEVGFNFTPHVEELPRSLVQLVIATKPE